MSEEISVREELYKYLDVKPFSRFTIVMASGDRYEVTDPHQVAVGQTVIIVIPRGSTHSLLRNNQISSIDVHESAA